MHHSWLHHAGLHHTGLHLHHTGLGHLHHTGLHHAWLHHAGLHLHHTGLHLHHSRLHLHHTWLHLHHAWLHHAGLLHHSRLHCTHLLLLLLLLLLLEDASLLRHGERGHHRVHARAIRIALRQQTLRRRAVPLSARSLLVGVLDHDRTAVEVLAVRHAHHDAHLPVHALDNEVRTLEGCVVYEGVALADVRLRITSNLNIKRFRRKRRGTIGSQASWPNCENVVLIMSSVTSGAKLLMKRSAPTSSVGRSLFDLFTLIFLP